ncbi:DUF3857 domain-containing protein [Ichthyenterobacterium magnum]|uniref:Uncharacterized protein DUF3857 n=1 Tax=Ichthyenterobacterium magnum TaxID=1230530 RepID=A0A420DFU2_9FLAO|nr:DUF3857 domain-containing protein [Ichthyenterobacterium magnum]RKE91954.1 uncharacterized protein DUF3857 [Ichthyenterobacterium magnum]
MKCLRLSVLLFVYNCIQIVAQNNLYSTITISNDLKASANAVVRLHETTIDLKSSTKMVKRVKRIISVLNKQGNRNVNAVVHYDDGLKINNLQVLVFDAFGEEIKKVKKKDFKDVSAVDGGTLYSDSRVKYLEYTPIAYPYTIELTYETETENTAFLPSFYPISSYYVSVEQSVFALNNPSEISIRKKEMNFESIEVEKTETNQGYSYKVKNLNAYKPEDHSPTLIEMVPKVMFAANDFSLEGVFGSVKNWDDFGKWMYKDLIAGTQNLPETTIREINELVKDEVNALDKAKKIYKYVQDKTRYISVQVGIGGWKPFNASEVDKLSYGDCKGLTNYTMSLLTAVGVKSNYTVVFSGSSQRNLESDFASIQGNHVILNIPQENKEDIWLECTSQKLPFGFIGDFTDDRDVLVVSNKGGKIKHTKKYVTEENIQQINSSYSILEDGSINVDLEMISKGIQYDNRYWLETLTQIDLDERYKNHWDYVNNIDIKSMEIDNDKEKIAFKEKISFNAANYGNMVGQRMLVVLNPINRNTYVPDRYRNRKLSLKINRGYKDVDEIEIHLPKGYKIEALPNNQNITNKFGRYSLEIQPKDKSTLIYKREFITNDGEFPKEDYKEFRNFYKEVAKLDNSKLSLIKE